VARVVFLAAKKQATLQALLDPNCTAAPARGH
jgi:hypothetical protein